MRGGADARENATTQQRPRLRPRRVTARRSTRGASRGAERKRFKSLAEFGKFLGSRGRNGAPAAETPELRALQDVEAALGVVGEEALHAILGSPVAEASISVTSASPTTGGDGLTIRLAWIFSVSDWWPTQPIAMVTSAQAAIDESALTDMLSVRPRRWAARQSTTARDCPPP